MGIRFGIIGCGSIARFHIAGLRKAGAEVVWLCDLDQDRARRLGQDPAIRITADFREILDDPTVEAVVVATVSSAHRQICLAAIGAGKAVVCEKTLAENPADAWEIANAAESAGTPFFTSYMKRFLPAVERALELLPHLGSIVTSHVRTHQPWGGLWRSTPDEGFFHTPQGGVSAVVRNYGGGVLVCAGSHLLDQILLFLGRPLRLYATVHRSQGQDYDIRAGALMETRNGPVHFEALAGPFSRNGPCHDGWDEQFEIIGSRGSLTLEFPRWDESEYKCARLIHYDEAAATRIEYHQAAVSPFDRAAVFFCGAIQTGSQGGQSRFIGYEVDELIAAILHSGREGCAIDIPWREMPSGSAPIPDDGGTPAPVGAA